MTAVMNMKNLGHYLILQLDGDYLQELQFVSESSSHQELPDDFIIPSEYYEKHRLVFSHYHLDRKLVRIGLNENQKRSKASQRIGIADSHGSFRAGNAVWSSITISREGHNLSQLKTFPREVTKSQYNIN